VQTSIGLPSRSGTTPRFDINYRRANESYRPPSDLRPAIDRILREEWETTKEMLTSRKDSLMRLAAKLVVERQMEITTT
jgi:hypothetical protein